MQLQELTSILQRPETLQAEQIVALKSLVDEYSYFQPARALYLKALKNKNSYKYNNALKVTAAHTTDRSVLFDFITSDVFNQNKISQQIKQNSEYIKAIEVDEIDDISINRSVTIDEALKQQVEATKGVLDPNLFEEKESEKQNIPSFEISGKIKKKQGQLFHTKWDKTKALNFNTRGSVRFVILTKILLRKNV